MLRFQFAVLAVYSLFPIKRNPHSDSQEKPYQPIHTGWTPR
jgi:hypothetical protein